MTRAAFALLAAMAACGGPPLRSEPPERARFRSLMGLNDRLKLEIQLLTAEPNPDAEIDRRIARLVEQIREVSALRPLPEPEKNDRLRKLGPEAIRELEALRGARWTPETREANWIRLEASCAVCHTELK